MKKKLTNLAKQLRKRQTPQEVKLWSLLRSRRFENFKFVRQFPIDHYIVDFCCRENKFIVELDGGQHFDPDSIRLDGIRDKYLKNKGYIVLRIPNNEVDGNLEGVYDMIRSQLVE